MNSIQELLSRFRHHQIQLWLEDNKLRYQGPKGALTPELRAELTKYKDEIIIFLLDAHRSTASEEETIQPFSREVSQIIPLSFAQQRLWFLDQLEGENATYSIPVFLKLVGDLNKNALDKAIAEIIQRHEVLRTSFSLSEREPIQNINKKVDFNLSIINLESLPDTEQQIEVEKATESFAKTPFDLSQSPLLRATLINLDSQIHILLLNFHHIIFDGWSGEIFLNELSLLYKAFNQGLPSPLSELPIQYADFSIWQRQWLTGKVLDTQLTYWKKHLQDAPPLLDLPTDHPRPAIQSYEGTFYLFDIPSTLLSRLTTLSQQTETTWFMILLATFACILSRYSGQTDLVIASPIANRNRPEIGKLIGFFANTLALRLDLSNNPSFLTLLKQVRQVIFDGYAHQDLPFEKLVEELHPARNLSYNPLFQVMFALQNVSGDLLELPNLKLHQLESDNGKVHFDLSLHIIPIKEGWVGKLIYSTDLFEAATIERMANHFLHLLEEILSNPQEKINRFSLLTDSEKEQLLYGWNRTQETYPFPVPIYQLFEAQVEKNPEAIALVYDDQCLSYQELNLKANKLARYLQTLGVQPETIVGIFLERSLEIVVSILGILKAGGAYLALDPDYPQDRLNYMLEDAQVSLIITQETLPDHLLSEKVQPICLNKIDSIITQYSRENPVSENTLEHLAYVIYTSGTTGHPKGVMVTQGNLSHYVQALSPKLGIKAQDRYLHTASFSFSSSVRQLMLPLSQGSTVIITTNEQRKNPLSLFTLIKQAQVSVIDLIPSFWRNCINILSSLEAEEINNLLDNNLRLIASASEPLLADIPKTWKTRFQPNVNLINMFGQTETTGIVAVYPINNLEEIGDKMVPAGKPIPNTQFYILDQDLQPVPVGVKGNLYIGGLGIARGYLNQQKSTDEKFISNPWKTEESLKLYQTGDLAKYRNDGTIEHLGRSDYQVKIRGFRVELGEIESVLNTHSDVQETVIVARKIQENEYKIVAYVVCNLTLDRIPYEQDCIITNEQVSVQAKTENITNNGIGIVGDLNLFALNQTVQINLFLPNQLDRHEFTAKIIWHEKNKAGLQLVLDQQQQSLFNSSLDFLIEEHGLLKLLQRAISHSLRNYLKKKLPDYMIPQQFILLEELPRLPNGKINRKALPDPDFSREDLGFHYVAPRNSTEDKLATIWTEVLKISQVGIYDNFFELGGHSLLATQVISRIRETFQIDLLLRTLFEKPTIADLAESIVIKVAEQLDSQDTLQQLLQEIDGLSEEEVQKILYNS